MNIEFYFAAIFECAAMLIPYAVCCFIPYTSRLRIKKSAFLILLSILFLVELSVLGFINDLAVWNTAFIVLCVLNYVVFAIAVNEKPLHLLFVYLLVMQFAAVFRGIRFYIDTRLLDIENPFNAPPTTAHIVMSVVECLIAFAAMIPISIILKKHLVPLMNAFNIKQWRIIFIIPLLFLAIILLFTYNMTDRINNRTYFLMLMIISVGSLAIYFVVFLTLKGASENALLREENLSLTYREKYYAMLSTQINETRIIRHDIRHHVQLLSEEMKNKEYGKAEAYLNEFSITMHESSDILYCEHYAVNTILNYYAASAKSKRIRISCNVRFPKESFVKNSDLCVLLGNCIENAVEGCERRIAQDNWISIVIFADQHKMTLSVDNTTGKTEKDKNGEYSSTKPNGLSMGHASIQAIAKKYNGSIWFEEKNEIFKTSVVLYEQSR